MDTPSRNSHFWRSLPRGRRSIVPQASVFVAGFLIFATLSVRFGPLLGFDMRNYHYYAAHAFLTDRFNLDYAPAQIQSFLNPLSFVPPYVLANHFGPAASGFIMGGIHGLALGLVFITALALFSSMAALPRVVLSLTCAGLGVYGPVFISVLGSSHNDTLISLIVLAAVYVMVRALARDEAPAWRKAVLIAGLLIGVAVGLKLSFAVFLIACGAAVLTAGRDWPSRFGGAGLFGLASFAGFLLARGFWMAALWSRFGSPLFPFYNKIFKSPYYYADRNFSDDRFLPETLEGALGLPFDFLTSTNITILSQHFRDSRYAIVYVLVLFYLVLLLVRYFTRRGESARQEGSRAGTFLLVFFVVSYIVWQVKFATIRYAAPLELLAPAAIALLILRTLRPGYLRWPATIAAFVLVVAVMRPLEFRRGEWHSVYFNLDPPRFDNPGETLVIMANDYPLAFVVPFFQSEVRFLGLWSTYSQRTGERERHRGTEEMLAMIRSHRGPVYLLSYVGGLREEALGNLEPYDLSVSDECVPLAAFSAAHRAHATRRATAAGELPPPERLCLFSVEVGAQERE